MRGIKPVIFKEAQYIIKNKSLFVQVLLLLAFSILFPFTYAYAAVRKGHIDFKDVLVLIELGKYVPTMIGVLFAAMLAAEAFAGEREKKTVEILVSTPLSYADLVLGKFISAIGLSVLLEMPSGLSFTLSIKYLIEVIDLTLRFPRLDYLLTITLLSISLIFLVGAWIILMSAYTPTRAAAATSALVILLPLSLLIAAASLFNWQINNSVILIASFALLLLSSLFMFFLLRMGSKEVLLLGLRELRYKQIMRWRKDTLCMRG